MLLLVFNLSYPQIVGATIFQPGETLTPDCAPGSANCGVATFSLNGQATSTQTLTTGSLGADFNIVSGLGFHTFNIPDASAIARGLLTASDWSIFSGKQNTLGFTPVSNSTTVNGQALTGNISLSTADILDSLNKRYITDAELTVLSNTSGTNTGDESSSTIRTKLGITTLSGSNTGDVIIGTGNGLSLSGQALSIALSGASATGTLSALDWNTFNNKQSALGYTPLNPANNLSDLANTGTARTNLGLGSLATLSAINNSNWSGTALSNANLANSSISFSTGTTGSDFNISGSPVSLGSTLTLNIPSASALNRGLLTSLDWSTFNSKQSALGFTPLNPANNLSDVANTSTARTNLGLGTLATQSGTFSGTHSGTSSGTNTGDQTTISGNAGTATSLQTARTINGVSFDGTGNITVTAAAGTLTGTTLASSVINSSLTSVGTLGSLVLSGTVTGATGYNGLVITPNTGTITTGVWNGTTIAVANGGTGGANGSITGTGALSFISNTTNAVTLDSGTTGEVKLGTGNNAKTISIGTGTAGNTINIGTNNTTADTIAIGSALDVFSLNSTGLKISTSGAITGATGITSSGTITFSSLTNCAQLSTNGSGVLSCGAGPDTATFTDTSPATIADNNTTELFNDATRPNITPVSASQTVLISVHDRFTGGGTTDTDAAVQIYRKIGGNPTCGTDTLVGDSFSAFMTNSTDIGDAAGIFLDSPATTTNVVYTVCSSANSVLGSAPTNNRIDVQLIVLGADLAETYFTNDATLGPGDVVAIDPNLPNGVKKSSSAYDPHVLGVVSTVPSITLYNVLGATNYGRTVPVALSGRTPIKVSTENGPIQAGDYLTPSSAPGVAMKASGTGPVIGMAMSAYDSEGIGMVMAFVKNFDIDGRGAVLLGDISRKVNSDGSDNGLSALIDTIQSETAHDPITTIAKKISDGVQFLTDFVAARVTAIRGYFDEVFARKIHTEQICVKKSDGTEVCMSGDQVNSLLKSANVAPAINPVPGTNRTPINNPEPTSSSTPPITIEPTSTEPISTETPADILPTPPDLPAGEAGATTGTTIETPPVAEQPESSAPVETQQ